MMLQQHWFLHVVTLFSFCYSFIHNNCTRSIRGDFQFPDCYIPDMNPDLSIHEASFLMSHDAATGYIDTHKAMHWFYSKTQLGGVYDQLQAGARALDVRPKVLKNQTVILQHDVVEIHVTLETMAQEAVNWCRDNPHELVLLLTNDLKYEQTEQDDDFYETNTADDNFNSQGTTLLQNVYQGLGITYVTCEAIYGYTVGEVMEISSLETGGYLLAMDAQDQYGSFCGKSNWIPTQLVTCYPGNGVTCLQPNHGIQPLASLKQYILESANNEPTDDAGTLGPPLSHDIYPFNEIQAMWQVTTSSALRGISHFSSILDDNKRSHINKNIVNWIHSGSFSEGAVSLLSVDNVALHGNAILTVLRTQCGGQSTLDVCGLQIEQPRMTMDLNLSQIIFWSIFSVLSFVLIRNLWRNQGVKILQNLKLRGRPQEDIVGQTQDQSLPVHPLV